MSDKLGPVELEFTIGNQVQEDAKRLQENIGGIGTASHRSAAALKQAIQEQRAVIKTLEDDIKRIEQQAQKAAPGLAQQGLTKELGAAKLALQAETAALNELDANLKKVDVSTGSLVTRKRKLMQAVAEMDMAGRRGTEEYKAMRQELAMLTDAHGDAAAQARILGNETQQFAGAVSGISAFAGALSAGAGAMGLLGGESEQFQKIQTRVQSLMAITIGLQQVATVLNKDSAFQLVTVAGAKKMYANAVGYLNTKLKINIGLSKAMVATGIGAIIAAVGLLIVGLMKWRERQKEVNDLQKQFSELSPEATKNIAQEKVEINALLRVAGNYNASLEVRQKAIEQLKSIMPEYNGYINEEGKLIDNSSEAIERYINLLHKTEIAKRKIARMVDIEMTMADTHKVIMDPEVSVRRRRRAREEYKEMEEEKRILQQEIGKLLSDKDMFTSIFGGGKEKEKDTSAAAKQVARQAATQYDAAADLQNKLLEIQAKTAQLLFDQREDNLHKRLDQVDREHQAELQKIDDFMRDVVERYNEANQGKDGFTPVGTGDPMASVAQIDPASAESFEKELEQLTAIYAQRRVQIQQDAATQVQAIMKELADSYISEQERELQAVREKYDGIRNEITRFQGFLTEAQKQALQAAQDKAEAAINDTWFMRTSEAFTSLFGDIEMKSSKALRQALATAKQIVEEKGASLDPSELDGYMSAIANAEALLQQRNPFKTLIQSIKEYRQAVGEVAREDALRKVFEDFGEAAILVSEGMNMAIGVINQLGGTSKQQQEIVDNIGKAVAGAGELAMGIASKNPLMIVQGAINLISAGIVLLDGKSREIERRMERSRRQLDRLMLQYNALNRATEQAMGTDVFSALVAERRNLNAQMIERRRLLELERNKGKKQDENAIQALMAEIQELEFQISDIYQQIFEKITQTSVKGLADELANALVDAFETGADAAEAFGAVANNVLQRAVQNALKMELLEKPLAEAMRKLKQKMGAFDDKGVFQFDGLTEEEAQAFRDEIARLGQAYATALQELGHIFDFADSPDKSLTGAIQGVTEQTAQLLGGQMNAMRLNQAESLALVREQLLHTAEIAVNTRHLREIKEILKDIRDYEPLKTQGL